MRRVTYRPQCVANDIKRYGVIVYDKDVVSSPRHGSQVFAEGIQERRLLYRLDQVLCSAQSESRFFLIHHRNDNDRDVSRLNRLLKFCQGTEATSTRHEYVQSDGSRIQLTSPLDSLGAGGNRGYGIARAFQVARQQLPRRRFVILHYHERLSHREV